VADRLVAFRSLLALACRRGRGPLAVGARKAPAMARPLVPSVLALVVAVVAAGCGGGGKKGSAEALAIVTGAARNTLGQTTLGRSTLHHPRAFGGSPAQLLALGVYDPPSKLTFARVDLPGPVAKNASPRQDHLVITPTTLFINPAATAALPKGKLWLSVPLASPASASGRAARFVGQATALDPQLLVGEIAWGAVSARSLGTSVVVHVPLDKYEVTVDLGRALTGARGPLARAARIAITQQLASLGGHGKVDLTVLVDADGRIAQLEGSVPGLGLGTISTTMSYGIKLTPSLPPSAQVVSLASVVDSQAWTATSPWDFAPAS